MAYTTPNHAQIRDSILTSMLGLNSQIAVDADSDFYLRASGEASAVEGLYQHQAWIAKQIFPDTSDIEMLERHCAQRLIKRKAAIAATGTIRITGTAGADVPIYTQANDSNGLSYQTTVAATVGVGGSVDIAAVALLPGSLSNQSNNTAVTLTDAPIGVDSSAVLLTMGSGADVESPVALLARYLDIIRYPAAGGNKFDWRRWAKAVDGVVDAFVYDLRRGNGTVDVAIISTTGLPSAQLLADVAAYVDSVRPVGLRGWSIISPTAIAINVAANVTLTGSRSMAQVLADFTAALAIYINTKPPGTPILKSRIETILSNIEGVKDRVLTSPAANVAPVVDVTHLEWAQLGTVNLTQV